MDRGAYLGPVRHVYVHVPFCRTKCDYCDFASEAVAGSGAVGTRVGAQMDGYVDGIAVEWRRERVAHDVRRLHTLYLGGGTPSLLGPDRLERLLELFRTHLTPGAEITVEANPEDVDARFAEWAAGQDAPPAAGVRGARAAGGRGSPLTAGRRIGAERSPARRPARVSLGVQSFQAGLRAGLGRRAAADPAGAVARLRAAGVRDLSIDLMHGLPGQSLVDLEDDIGAVLALRPEHVSWYELCIAVGTPLARAASGLDIPDDDTRSVMYRRVVSALQRAGYSWYEVSNFALPGRWARHNVAYWRARSYLGLGPGAVSTVGRSRWTNVADVAAWRAALAAGAAPPRETEDLDEATRARERVMLAARCGASLRLADIATILDETAAARLAAAGLVSVRDGTIRVTRKGRYVADEVCVRLFRD